MAGGTSTTFTSQSCSPVFTTPTYALDWGTPVEGNIYGPAGSNDGGLGPASLSGMGGDWPADPGSTLNAGVGGIGIQITSNDQLTRADNTEWAWNGSNWEPASFVDSNNVYFAGHFGAPSASTATVGYYGDNLLGALAYNGSNNGAPTMTLTFSQQMQWVGFQVSSASTPDFIAELLAFNSQGQQIGTYLVNTNGTGVGGMCAGLALRPPQPCNDAPLIQFYDPNGTIASVELVMLNDTSGLYIDSLSLEEGAVPEPATFAYFAAALLCLIALRSITLRSTWMRSLLNR